MKLRTVFVAIAIAGCGMPQSWRPDEPQEVRQGLMKEVGAIDGRACRHRQGRKAL